MDLLSVFLSLVLFQQQAPAASITLSVSYGDKVVRMATEDLAKLSQVKATVRSHNVEGVYQGPLLRDVLASLALRPERRCADLRFGWSWQLTRRMGTVRSSRYPSSITGFAIDRSFSPFDATISRSNPPTALIGLSSPTKRVLRDGCVRSPGSR